MADINEYGSEFFFNRELSWIEFNARVLSEARDKTNPLFERLKFLSITASNFDEFFMIRVASLKDMVNAGYEKKDIAGMKPQKQLDEMHPENISDVRRFETKIKESEMNSIQHITGHCFRCLRATGLPCLAVSMI